MIFQWVEKVRDIVQQMKKPESYLEVKHENMWREETSVEPFCVPEETTDIGFEISHGLTITDRKSVFQGHLAVVTSVEDVK